ncbi:MAG: leucine-rich repeat protein, partial [Faecousia sp.]
MKKRFFCLALALCMLFALMPMHVFAADTYDLRIGADVGFKTTETNTTKNITGGGTATLVRGTNASTLTLSGINISYGEAQHAAIQSGISNLTIVLKGTNTITLTNDDVCGMFLLENTTIQGESGSKLIINANGNNNYGLYTDSAITLTLNNLTMTVNHSGSTGSVTGIQSAGTVNLQNTCTIQMVSTASADNSDLFGYVDTSSSCAVNIGSNANVTFDGWENALDVSGTMNLTGGSLTIRNSYDGIYHAGTLNLTGGTLNSSGSRLGILTASTGQIKFAGTNATLTGGTAGWGETSSTTSTYSVTGGTVVFQGGEFAASGMYSSLASNYSVFAGADKDNVTRIDSPTTSIFTHNKYVRIEPSTYYTLTLVNVSGATSASYMEGDTISYTAAAAPSGSHFRCWNMTVDGSTTTVGTGTTYTGKMPAANATLTAVYENCSGGTATCQAKPICSVCGKEYGILAVHSFMAEVVDSKYEITPVTCEQDGVYYKSCPICGASSENWNNATFTVTATGHTAVTIPGKAATCTEDGLTDGSECSVCGKTLTVQTTITAKGHTEETITGKPATCTEDGLTDGKKCSVCGIILEAQQTIPGGHVFVDNVCTGCGAINGSIGGSCGSNVTWTLTEDGILTISGKGSMYHGTDTNNSPWAAHADKIQQVIVEEGVTNIGHFSFYKCTNLTSVTLPQSLLVIGNYAFFGCTGLTSITIPESVNTIRTSAFQGCTGLKSITFTGNAPTVGTNAFYRVTATAYYPGDNTTWTSDKLQNYGGKLTWELATPPGVTVSGTVSSFGTETEDVTVQLIKDGETEPAYTVTVQGKSAAYTIENVEVGSYILRVSKTKHAAREYTVTVESDDITQNAQILLYGDVTGDGLV